MFVNFERGFDMRDSSLDNNFIVYVHSCSLHMTIMNLKVFDDDFLTIVVRHKFAYPGSFIVEVSTALLSIGM